MKNTTEYAVYAGKRAKKSDLLPDCLRAFLTGGLICAGAQGMSELFLSLRIAEETVRILVPMILIFLTALLTGLGIFDNLAGFCGAGTLVPITGFANAVVSPALDSKNEGLVLGLGAKLFSVAGPVILYGTSASVVWGVLYWALGQLR